MSKQGILYVGDELDRIIEYCKKEFDMSYAETVGTLMFKTHELMHDTDVEEEE